MGRCGLAADGAVSGPCFVPWCLCCPLGSENAALVELQVDAGKQQGTLMGHERSQGLGLEAASLTSIGISQETVQLWELAWLQEVKEEDKK